MKIKNKLIFTSLAFIVGFISSCSINDTNNSTSSITSSFSLISSNSSSCDAISSSSNEYKSSSSSSSTSSEFNNKYNEEDINLTEYKYNELTNIALGRPIYASSDEKGSASRANDGDSTTRWESNWEDDEWIYVDLGLVTEIECIDIYWETARAKEYVLEYSIDEINFEELITYTETDNSNIYDTFDFGDISAQYIRIKGISRTTNYGYSIYELEIYSYKGVVKEVEKFNYSEIKSLDDEQEILIDLKTMNQLSQIVIHWSYENYATDYIVYGSSDNLSFDILYTMKNGNNWSHTLNIESNNSYRYIKVEFKKRALASNAYMINRFNVYNLLGTLISKTATAKCSSVESGYSINNILDDFYGSHWSSKINELGVTSLDLKEEINISKLELKWTNNTGKYYDILFSLDGEKYNTKYRMINGDGEVDVIEFYSKARYIKIYEYSRNDLRYINLESLNIITGIEKEEVFYEINELPKESIVNVNSGSYLDNNYKLSSARVPTYLSDELKEKPIESNGWWQSLIIDDYGNNLILNPLNAKYNQSGYGMSYSGSSYYDGGYKVSTVSEIFLSIDNVDSSSTYNIVSRYDDFSVDVEFTDNGIPKMKTTFVQGSPYIYNYFLKGSGISLSGTYITEILDLELKSILNSNGETYTGNAIILKTNFNNNYINENKYYLVACPDNTVFSYVNNRIKVTMNNDKYYMSLGMIPNIEKINYYLEHSYSFITSSIVNYSFDEVTNDVTTEYQVETQLMNNKYSDKSLFLVMPHQYNMDEIEGNYTEDKVNSIRGELKVYEGNSFKTIEKFSGMVPFFSEPENSEYSRDLTVKYLEQLDNATSGYLFSADAYWQGKTLQPLATGALVAHELELFDYRDTFLNRIRTILKEWYTYSPNEIDYCFYYENNWGSLIYNSSEFGANSGLTDHHFTYGYYVYASAILSYFDENFFLQYKDFIDLLIRDYASPYRNDSMFPYLRNFDPWAGHSWAGGYADSDGGNNQEAGGESIFSYVGQYIYGLISDNKDFRDTGIYIFTTELQAIKDYWFNYSDIFIDDYPYGVAGQVWGNSYNYGTYFGMNREYIYGIHWLPIGEYLTSYAIGKEEQENIKELYANFMKESLEAQGKEENGWYHIIWNIRSLSDPSGTLKVYDDSLPQANETFMTYWFINNMIDLNNKTNEYWCSNNVGYSFYKNEGQYYAIVFNPQNQEQDYKIYNEQGIVKTLKIGAKTTERIKI